MENNEETGEGIPPTRFPGKTDGCMADGTLHYALKEKRDLGSNPNKSWSLPQKL